MHIKSIFMLVIVLAIFGMINMATISQDEDFLDEPVFSLRQLALVMTAKRTRVFTHHAASNVGNEVVPSSVNQKIEENCGTNMFACHSTSDSS